MSDSAYAHPESLVDTAWLAENLDNPNIRIVESNEDVLLYGTGHIPNAAHVDWKEDLQDPVTRDFISPEAFAALASRIGITPETTVIFYGDKANWWAAYALWAFQLYGHTNSKILNGGRAKWIAEERPLVKDVPQFAATQYPQIAERLDSKVRAFRDETIAHSAAKKPLIDVRSPGEFKGEVTHMPEYPQEGVLRGGHIPNAKSVPWKTAANDDGTFKSAEELRKIYVENLGFLPEDETIVYCRIGERSSHTWFVLTQLLGFPKVRNYDGSWTEYGNSVRVPIEKS